MPVTPFHFGPGAAIHVLAPKQVSFLAFCASNVLIDIEPLYFMLTQQYPLHRFFHTYIGATLVAGATVVLLIGMHRLASRLHLSKLLKWQNLSLFPVSLGAAVGCYSHIFLDSFMHEDIAPFAPVSTSNPLLHAVPLDALHWACIASGSVAVCILYIRGLPKKHNPKPDDCRNQKGFTAEDAKDAEEVH